MTDPRTIKNALATLTIHLNIPESRVAELAKANGRDPANDDDYEPILDALGEAIMEEPSQWLDFETSTEVEVDA